MESIRDPDGPKMFSSSEKMANLAKDKAALENIFNRGAETLERDPNSKPVKENGKPTVVIKQAENPKELKDIDKGMRSRAFLDAVAQTDPEYHDWLKQVLLTGKDSDKMQGE